MTEREIVEAAGLLTPYEIRIRKIRLGPKADCGHVFDDCVTAERTIISYGISTQHSNIHYICESVAGVTDEAALLYSVEVDLPRHRIEDDRLFLKMEVKDDEFDALIAIPCDVLQRFKDIVFECIIFEMHNL